MTSHKSPESAGRETRSKPEEASARGLTDRSIAAIKWNYIGVVARIASQLVVQVALARLLGPEPIGLFAFAMLLIGSGGIVVELGLGSALVQSEFISRADVQFVRSRTLVAGVVVATTIFFFSPAVAAFFSEPRITDVLRAICPAFVLQALAIVPISLLKRDLAFRQLQSAQVASYILGFLFVGVGLAIFDAGVWSLVAAYLTQSGLAAVLLYLSSRRLTLATEDAVVKGARTNLRRFSVRVLLTNVANWVVENVDNLLVGKLFGTATLGLYSISYNLVRTPANHLVVTLQMVLFAASARAQHQQANLRKAYLTVTSATALIALPTFFGIAAISNTLVTVLFGTHWLGAAPVLVPLSMAMSLHALMALAGPVLWGKGSPGTEFKVQFLTAIALVIALLLASNVSVVALGWAVCGVYAGRYVAMTAALMRHTQISLLALVRSLRGGLIACFLVTPLLVACETAFGNIDPTFRLGLEVLAGALSLIAFVLVLPQLAISPELAELLVRILSRTPSESWISLHIRRNLASRCTSPVLND